MREFLVVKYVHLLDYDLVSELRRNVLHEGVSRLWEIPRQNFAPVRKSLLFVMCIIHSQSKITLGCTRWPNQFAQI